MTPPKKKNFSTKFNESVTTVKSATWIIALLSGVVWAGIALPQIGRATDKKATELRTEFYGALNKMAEQQRAQNEQQRAQNATTNEKLNKVIGWMSFINSTQDPKKLEKFQDEYNFLNK